jgi:lysophospholipase L1-like esterase
MSEAGPKINNVLAVDHASVTGGQAKVALESALGLNRAGFRPIIFAAALDSGDRRTPELFREDTLHLNSAGYVRRTAAVRRALPAP